MKKLTYLQILMLQKAYNVTNVQNDINSGLCWHMEGSQGRFAMNMLEAGICMLPLVTIINYYGNKVPSRNMLETGSKGSFKNCQNFWQKIYDGDSNNIDTLENIFGMMSEEML